MSFATAPVAAVAAFAGGIDSPLADEFTKAPPQMFFSGTDLVGPTDCQIDFPDGSSSTKKPCGEAGGAGPGTFVWNPATALGWGVALGEGRHTYHLELDGGSGLTISDSATFTIDHTDPIVFLPPGAYGDWTYNRQPIFSFSLIEANPFESRCSFDAAPSVPCDGEGMPTTPLAVGAHTFTVVHTDRAQNSGLVTFAFRVVPPPPPTSGSLSTKGGPVRGSKFTARLDVSLFVPPSIIPAQACKGKLALSVTPKVRRAPTLKSTAVLAFARGRCTATAKRKMPSRFKGRRARVKVTWAGNELLGAYSFTRSTQPL